MVLPLVAPTQWLLEELLDANGLSSERGELARALAACTATWKSAPVDSAFLHRRIKLTADASPVEFSLTAGGEGNRGRVRFTVECLGRTFEDAERWSAFEEVLGRLERDFSVNTAAMSAFLPKLKERAVASSLGSLTCITVEIGPGRCNFKACATIRGEGAWQELFRSHKLDRYVAPLHEALGRTHSGPSLFYVDLPFRDGRATTSRVKFYATVVPSEDELDAGKVVRKVERGFAADPCIREGLGQTVLDALVPTALVGERRYMQLGMFFADEQLSALAYYVPYNAYQDHGAPLPRAALLDRYRAFLKLQGLVIDADLKALDAMTDLGLNPNLTWLAFQLEGGKPRSKLYLSPGAPALI